MTSLRSELVIERNRLASASRYWDSNPRNTNSWLTERTAEVTEVCHRVAFIRWFASEVRLMRVRAILRRGRQKSPQEAADRANHLRALTRRKEGIPARSRQTPEERKAANKVHMANHRRKMKAARALTD